VDLIAADTGDDSGKAGPDGLDALLAGRGVDVVTFNDWQKIEAAETARARDGSPREKFVSIDEMIAASRT
jgi:ferredoxin--NADP+ reductase